MTAIPLLSAGLVMTMIAVLFVICSVVLILVVLVQKGRGGGLSGALGGAMASGILGDLLYRLCIPPPFVAVFLLNVQLLRIALLQEL